MERKSILAAAMIVLTVLIIIFLIIGSCTFNIQFTKDFSNIFSIDDSGIQLSYGDTGAKAKCSAPRTVRLWGPSVGHGLFSLKIPVKVKENGKTIVLYCRHFKSNSWYKSGIKIKINAENNNNKALMIETNAEWRDMPIVGKKKKREVKKVIKLGEKRSYVLIQTGN